MTATVSTHACAFQQDKRLIIVVCLTDLVQPKNDWCQNNHYPVWRF